LAKFDESPLHQRGFSFFGNTPGQQAIFASAVFT
jgi:hypothetical protein